MLTDKWISLDGDAFRAMKTDFDQILSEALTNMETKNADEATITLKLNVRLDTDTSYTEDGGYVDYTRPTFRHDVSYVMQVKGKLAGQTTEERALVFDDDAQKWVLREVFDGQMSFDNNGVLSDGFGRSMPENSQETPQEISEAKAVHLPSEENNGTERLPEGNMTVVGYPQGQFEYMKQFIGKNMEVVKEDRGYSVRLVSDYRIVLMSDTPGDTITYIPEENVWRGVGHPLECISYGIKDHIIRIAIECSDTEDVIWEIEESDEPAETE